ncbi:PAS domain-containing protein [Geothrix sp. PMB-07]|uniref:PAS domain-containing protein n=1 Tax=Geothrix sp. PMB-07 TaxID=3068640 RepID=UPI0027416839|nr:PAS domain-containing protein [Geothrix sp. PMB-07]WLT32523.1 PAS domain-containing protein [Geothrix sp. PMB-07]
MADPGDPETSAVGQLWPWPEQAEVMRTVLDASTDPIFNILEDGTYRYVNAAFSGPFGKTPTDIIGKRIWDLFDRAEAEKRMSVVTRAFATGETIVFDVRVPTATGDRHYITSVRPILDAEARVSSVVCISKDITERKRIELEREKLIQDLQTALARVQTLSGLLPICAHCNKIRDEQGDWTRIESYISAHSRAEFSHSICPDCARGAFPEMNG